MKPLIVHIKGYLICLIVGPDTPNNWQLLQRLRAMALTLIDELVSKNCSIHESCSRVWSAIDKAISQDGSDMLCYPIFANARNEYDELATEWVGRYDDELRSYP